MTTLHEATRALTRASRLPGLVVATDLDDGTNAVATGCRGHDLPIVRMGQDLMTKPARIRLAVLAHEIAHQELGHTSDPLPGRVEKLAWAVGGVCFMQISNAVNFGFSLLMVAGILVPAVSSLAFLLLAKNLDRKAEYEADHCGVKLLDAAGFPGREYMRAMVDDLRAEEPKPSSWAWIFYSHPHVNHRAARLR